MFDYQRKTRDHYKSEEVAESYHDSYTRPRGWRGLRFRLVARWERKAVDALLGKIDAERVVDIPAGTGKMAPVLREHASHVLACDVSEKMLDLAEETYRRSGPANLEFRIVDLAEATSTIRRKYDLTLCIRLMHRVPDEVKRKMLSEIARLTPYSIVSFAVDSAYQRVRRSVRRLFLGGEDVAMETRPDMPSLNRMVRRHFTILESSPIARGLSAEWVYLLRSKSSADSG